MVILHATTNEATDLLSAALDYASRGYSVIPVVGKKAAGFWKPFQEHPADETTLRHMFSRPNVTGLALILGSVSGGLAVRDFDDADAYRAWAASYPEDAGALPTVQTARGFHVYGHLDREAYKKFSDGELRAKSSHYVLAPPSQHPDGPTYVWVNPLPARGQRLPALPKSLRRDWKRSTQQPKQLIACVPSIRDEAINATLPTGPGQRNRKVFDLARRLKAIPGLSKAELKEIVTEWHRRALPVIRTQDFQETWIDFQVSWGRIKIAHGTTPRRAYQAALKASTTPIDGVVELGTLAEMCRILASTERRQRFFLSCRTVAEVFGVPRMRAYRWLESLQFHDVIRLLKKGRLKARKASTWKYQGGQP
ncbi:MAG TPA: bifunctional DNA primase/polymerase [Gemmataceae bacterium]|nr:bifunctional DNA primase/polymerase [Gemmataceae bacterium]